MNSTRLFACFLFVLAACAAKPGPTDAGDTNDSGIDAGTTDAGVDAGITVGGRVTNSVFNDGLSGATVAIGGQTTTTDTDGHFSMADVATPYDLTLTYGSPTLTVIVEGLTRTDPTIETSQFGSLSQRSATVNGVVTGVTFPLPTDHYVRVLSGGFNGGTTGVTLSPGASDGTYSLPINWAGTDSKTINVFAVEYTLGAHGVPTAFGGYAKISVPAFKDAIYNNQNIVLAAPVSGTVTANLTEPVAPTGLGAYMGLHFEPACNLDFTYTPTPSGAFAGTLPAITGVSAYASVIGGFAEGSSYDSPRDLTPPVTVSLSTAQPLSTQPADHAAYSASTGFGWDSLPSGVYVFHLDAPGGAHVLTLYTRRTQVTLPPGITTGNGTYTWSVDHALRQAAADDIAVPYGISYTPGRVTSATKQVTFP